MYLTGFGQILTGHEKGVLSLSWCKQDSDLLLSCGKDNRALCWNPQTSEMIGEVGICHPASIQASPLTPHDSFRLQITGHSRLIGVLATLTSSPPPSSTALSASTLSSPPTRRAKHPRRLNRSTRQTSLGPQVSRVQAKLLFRSRTLRSGCVALSLAHLAMEASLPQSRTFPLRKVRTRAAWCTSARS